MQFILIILLLYLIVSEITNKFDVSSAALIIYEVVRNAVCKHRMNSIQLREACSGGGAKL